MTMVRASRTLLALPLLVGTAGCLGPEVMILSNLTQAAIITAVEYNEKNKPTPDEAWRLAMIEHLRGRAEEGDTEASYSLAQLYEANGDASAQTWMCRAADAGQAKAQLQVGHWYNEDRLDGDIWPYIAIRPDDRKAFVWYSLAQKNGDPFATRFRERLIEQRMTPAELSTAKKRLARWRPGTCPRSVIPDRDPRAVPLRWTPASER